MLRSTSRFTSFSKLESNPPQSTADFSETITPPAQVRGVRIGALNELSSPQGGASGDQGFKHRDLSEGIVRPRFVRPAANRVYSLRARQRWEGTVTDVGTDEFTAVLTDLSDPQNGDEEAVFTLSELDLPDEELRLVAPGSTFYWILGTEKSPAGIARNVSIFQFRRSPRWSVNALRRARAKADRFGKLFTGSQ